VLEELLSRATTQLCLLFKGAVLGLSLISFAFDTTFFGRYGKPGYGVDLKS